MSNRLTLSLGELLLLSASQSGMRIEAEPLQDRLAAQAQTQAYRIEQTFYQSGRLTESGFT
jgi:hypothetical protein